MTLFFSIINNVFTDDNNINVINGKEIGNKNQHGGNLIKYLYFSCFLDVINDNICLLHCML